MEEQKLCTWIFNGLCWIATTTVVVYWIYEFSLNEDLCVVDYKKFYEDGSDPYPVLSMCFADPFVSSKLEGIGAGLNKKLYSMFLGGDHFNTQMMDIDYNNNFVTEYYITWKMERMRLFLFYAIGIYLYLHFLHFGIMSFTIATGCTPSRPQIFSILVFS